MCSGDPVSGAARCAAGPARRLYARRDMRSDDVNFNQKVTRLWPNGIHHVRAGALT
ncbi:hypothetical protein GCM10023223_40620 [Stackebrandtia albiflava]